MINLILILITLATTVSVFAGANLENEIACYKALIGDSVGANYMIDNKIVLIPKEENGKLSLFSYDLKGAYRRTLPNPKKAYRRSGNVINYALKFQLPGEKPYYIDYGHVKSKPTNPGITITYDENNVSPEKQNKMQDFVFQDDLNAKSRKVFHDELIKRIKTIHGKKIREKENFTRLLKDPKHKKKRSLYKSRINKLDDELSGKRKVEAFDVCNKVSAESVKSAVTLESKKFPDPKTDVGSEENLKKDNRGSNADDL